MKTQVKSRPTTGELAAILSEELAAHHRLLQLELKKREAILARDGEKLRQAVFEQSRELGHIELLENRRQQAVAKLLPEKNDPILSDILASEKIPEQEKSELAEYQKALRSALAELKRLSELNGKLLADSRELFQVLLSAYSSVQKGGVRPVLVSASC